MESDQPHVPPSFNCWTSCYLQVVLVLQVDRHRICSLHLQNLALKVVTPDSKAGTSTSYYIRHNPLAACYGSWTLLGRTVGWLRPFKKLWAGIFPYTEWRVNQTPWSRLHSECDWRCHNDEINILLCEMKNWSCAWRNVKAVSISARISTTTSSSTSAARLLAPPWMLGASWRIAGSVVCLLLSLSFFPPRCVLGWWAHSWVHLFLPPIFGGFLDACRIAGPTSPPSLPPSLHAPKRVVAAGGAQNAPAPVGAFVWE